MLETIGLKYKKDSFYVESDQTLSVLPREVVEQPSLEMFKP